MNSVKNLLLVLSIFLAVTAINGSTDTERKPYIIYMGDATPMLRTTMSDDHHRFLTTAFGDEDIARKSKIYSYGKSFNAIAAKLFPHEAERIKDMEGVISVFPNTIRKLHTTRSWDFIGMPETIKRNPKIESNMIVGLLDTGIDTTSPSFNDDGYGPPPAKWKGKCATGANFTGCNNKVIGARYYKMTEDTWSDEAKSPADRNGHGTHTSSTAAGVAVKGASLYGLAKGTARGGVPSARLAMYKVCWDQGCGEMDMLAAIDDAIEDGVDVISISIGSGGRNYFEDSVAIGAFHAMRKGILTTCSAGNDGPLLESMDNSAPWILTVGATGMDRQFRTDIKLGDGEKITGISINTFTPKKKTYTLVKGDQVATNGSEWIFGLPSECASGTLDASKARGKIIYCASRYSLGQSNNVYEAGGAGTILSLLEFRGDVAFSFPTPTVYVDPDHGDMIARYINSTEHAYASIQKSKTIKAPAPYVVSFSSRGPVLKTPNLIKPDIGAPGVDIMAAWTRLTSMTGQEGDNRFVKYNIISGTSMACPHAAGAAAYVKTFHPDWSPAAVKSALMTTATKMAVQTNDSIWGAGSGQIDPISAIHPGLVYDLTEMDYIRFLCKEGYSGTLMILATAGRVVNCSSLPKAQGSDGLNYPSMQFRVSDPNNSISATFYRTVTHVGNGRSVYKATVRSNEGLIVTVVPNTLKFNKLDEKKSFKVMVKGSPLDTTLAASAWLEWSDSEHTVKSPIVIYQW